MLVLVMGMLCPVSLLSPPPLLTQLPLHRPAPGPCQRKAATYHRTPTTATFSTITNLMRIYLQLYFLLKIFIYSCLILLKRNMETVNRIFDTCDNRNWWKCQCRGVWVSECRSVWVSLLSHTTLTTLLRAAAGCRGYCLLSAVMWRRFLPPSPVSQHLHLQHADQHYVNWCFVRHL